MITREVIRSVCDNFSARSRIKVSEAAQRLIVDLINSVETDRHESWRPNPRLFNEYYSEWPETVPGILEHIARDHRLKQQITMIDVAFWISYNFRQLDILSKCPFPGPNEIPDGTTMTELPFPWSISNDDNLSSGQEVH